MDFAFFRYCQQPVWEDLARAELWGGVSEVSLSSLELPRGVGDPAGMSVIGPAFFKSATGCFGALKIPAGWHKRLLMEQGQGAGTGDYQEGGQCYPGPGLLLPFTHYLRALYALPR